MGNQKSTRNSNRNVNDGTFSTIIKGLTAKNSDEECGETKNPGTRQSASGDTCQEQNETGSNEMQTHKRQKKKKKSKADRFDSKRIVGTVPTYRCVPAVITDELGNDRYRNPSSSRQEYCNKIQAMIDEAERLEGICKSQHFEHSNSTHDHSLCPFLQSMSNIEQCFGDLRKQIEDITREKKDYLNRLSNVVDSMLTENDPNIKDLNDPNRPTRLAEKWCKIYDDEWTDALESLERKYYEKKHQKHDQFVYHLLSFVKVIYKFCQKKARHQVKSFLLLTNSSRTEVEYMWSQIQPTERQHFTDSRKRMAEANINMLQKIIINDNVYQKKIRDLNPVLDKEILGILETSSYFQKCLEICWQFVIADPPLYLDMSSLVGETINKDTHKEYTRTGAVIKYVVWPALYLHCKNNEIGALLAKGVVQPEN